MHRISTVVSIEAGGTSCGIEPVSHLRLGKLPGGDELMQPVTRAVEHIVPGANLCCCNGSELLLKPSTRICLANTIAFSGVQLTVYRWLFCK
jgi:hypothetical protein